MHCAPNQTNQLQLQMFIGSTDICEIADDVCEILV